MSIPIIISHQVEDFGRWKIGFYNHESARAETKIQAKAYRNTDDPNHVYVIGTAESKEAFDGFSSSPDLQKAMKKAEVISQPEFTILEEAQLSVWNFPTNKVQLRRGFVS